MSYTGIDHYNAWLEAGQSYRGAARALGVDESTTREAVKRFLARLNADPAIKAGMKAIGLDKVPAGGWIKSTEPDENGLLYSWYVKGEKEAEEAAQDLADRLHEVFSNLPAVTLPGAANRSEDALVGLIPMNDIHAGAFAWGEETGYGDWDLKIATDRIKVWAGDLISKMPVCKE